MSAHCPRPPEYPADPDKAFCGVRLSQAPAGVVHTFAEVPQAIECDACSFRYLRWLQSRSEGPVTAEHPGMVRFPWAPLSDAELDGILARGTERRAAYEQRAKGMKGS